MRSPHPTSRRLWYIDTDLTPIFFALQGSTLDERWRLQAGATGTGIPAGPRQLSGLRRRMDERGGHAHRYAAPAHSQAPAALRAQAPTPAEQRSQPVTFHTGSGINSNSNDRATLTLARALGRFLSSLISSLFLHIFFTVPSEVGPQSSSIDA